MRCFGGYLFWLASYFTVVCGTFLGPNLFVPALPFYRPRPRPHASSPNNFKQLISQLVPSAPKPAPAANYQYHYRPGGTIINPLPPATVNVTHQVQTPYREDTYNAYNQQDQFRPTEMTPEVNADQLQVNLPPPPPPPIFLDFPAVPVAILPPVSQPSTSPETVFETESLLEESDNDDKVELINFSCDGRVQGYYADVERKCKGYYQCMSIGVLNVMHQFSCPDNTFFDQSLLVCVNADRALPCEKAPRYFSINEDRLKVISSDDVGEESGYLPHFSCFGKEAGNYPDMTSNCHLFFQCTNSSPGGTGEMLGVVMACPNDFVFDSKQNRCVPQYPEFVCFSD